MTIELSWSGAQVGGTWEFTGFMHDISERKRLEATLNTMALHDALTGLLNRRAFMEALEGEMARFQRHRRPSTLLMLDLDHFKLVNDRHGHAVGDLVLAQVCATVRERLRRTDRIGRLGGEEFAVLLPDTEQEGALVLAETLRRAVAALEVLTPSGPLAVTVSIGLATFKPGEHDAVPLLSRADQALYQAKAQGRNRVAVAEDVVAEV
jgi:diguanylate cyclase (GGDEF)-like protein